MRPLFDTKGVPAVSAVINNAIGTSGYMTYTQLQELQTSGWEIAGHTMTHPDLRDKNEAELRTELGTSRQILADSGLVVKNLVYPSHYSNELVRRIAREYYRSARGGNQGLNPPVLDMYRLASVHSDPFSGAAEFETYVDQAAAQGGWVIFYLHATDSADSVIIGTVINYIKNKDIPIVTIDQALDLIENVYDGGDNAGISEGGIRGKLFADSLSSPAGCLTLQETTLDVRNSLYHQISLSSNTYQQTLNLGVVANTVGGYIALNSKYDYSYLFTPSSTGSAGINFRQDGSLEFWGNSGLTSGTDFLPTKHMTISNIGNITVSSHISQSGLPHLFLGCVCKVI